MKNFVSSFFFSFFSPTFYRNVALQWKGIAAKYLWQLAFLTGIVWTSMFMHTARTFVEATLLPLANQIPVLYFKKDTLSMQKDSSPVALRDSNRRILAIIDTRPEAVLAAEKIKVPVFITNQFILIREWAPYPLLFNFTPREKPIAITAEYLNASFETALHYLPIPVFIFMFLSAFSTFWTLQWLHIFLGKYCKKRWKLSLERQQFMRLTAVALTPGFFLTAILWFGLQYALSFWFWWLISVAYFIFALWVNKKA